MNKKFVIRNANFTEMPFILTLATEEDWNPGFHDASAFYAMDSQGFFIGELEGIKVGCVSAVSYTNDFGFIGLLIVKPEYRHSGLGLVLAKAALARMGSRVVGINIEPKNHQFLLKYGFGIAFKTIRYEGSAKSMHSPPPSEKIANVPFEMLADYDSLVFGVWRQAFLKKWIAMPNSMGLALLENGKLKGYGIIRSCIHGYRIGPLFADEPEIAYDLLTELTIKIGKAPFYIDIPENNGFAIAMARKMQLTPVSETFRMYNGQPPKQLLEKVYGNTTQELG